MKKKTKKIPKYQKLEEAIQLIYGKIMQIDNLLGLYLEYKKDTGEFERYVEKKVNEHKKRT